METQTQRLTEGDLNNATAWHVIETYFRQELTAKFHLNHAKFRVYLPMRVNLSTRPNAPRSLPFLPGYLFLGVDPSQPRWSDAHAAIGVRSLLAVAGRPCPAPLRMIDEIKEQEDARGLVVLKDKSPIVRPAHTKGDKVRVVAGAMAGYDALFEEQVDEHRSVLFMKFLGQETRTVVSPAAIKAAS
jgi:transcription antitermination factor NusG